MTTGLRHSTCFFIASETTLYFSMFFDLIEVGGEDLRREPLEQRKIELRRLLADTEPGLEHFPLRMKRNQRFVSSWRIHWV